MRRLVQMVRDRSALSLRDERVLEALSLGLLFIGGATVVLLSLLFPQPSQENKLAAAALAVLGYPAGLVVLKWGHRLPTLASPVLLATGTGLTCAGIYVAHGAGVGASAAFFFVWVTLFAFHFFSLRAALFQLALAGAGYGVVQGLDGGPGSAAEWILAIGTASVAGVVMWLVGRQLRRAAGTDYLTGLPNRSALQQALVVEIARAIRDERPLCLAVVDIDGFKAVNDRLGHAAGDALLTEQALAWNAQLRATDLLARYGGDEFVVILPGVSKPEAEGVIERMVAVGPVRASVGIACFVPEDDPQALLERADQALYRTKLGDREIDPGTWQST